MDSRIRRGIDLQNRLWETSVGRKLVDASKWWDGGPIDRFTFLGVFVLLFLNAFLVSALIGKEVANSFSQSVFLLLIANLFVLIGVSKSIFFTTISILTLAIAPISVYLFARKIVHRHELTAFLCTLLFVIPNPLSSNGLPNVAAIFASDGAHAISFVFIPLFLLYFKAFIRNGLFIWGVFSAIGSSLFAIISPFAFMNLIIFFLVIAVSEGFMGGLRIKALRLLFVLFCSFCLSYFWYNPSTLTEIALLEGVRFAIDYLWRMFPVLIPAVPTIGAISFLIFDRREKLQPVFIALALFLIYTGLFSISNNFNITGIFIPSRYNIELSFSKSLLASVILGFLLEFFYQKMKTYVKESNDMTIKVIFGFSIIISFAALFIISFIQVLISRRHFVESEILSSTSKGIGTIGWEFKAFDTVSILSALVSLLTLGFLIYLFRYYPPNHPEGPKIRQA